MSLPWRQAYASERARQGYASHVSENPVLFGSLAKNRRNASRQRAKQKIQVPSNFRLTYCRLTYCAGGRREGLGTGIHVSRASELPLLLPHGYLRSAARGHP